MDVELVSNYEEVKSAIMEKVMFRTISELSSYNFLLKNSCFPTNNLN